ncbi:MAG: LCP family protein [Coriobacteriales bacterium]|nr:LCP family protein [Coriobacteriales bacterium]
MASSEQNDPHKGPSDDSQSRQPLHASHLNDDGADGVYLMGHSDPDSTLVYVQAARRPRRRRAAHMDLQRQLDAEVDEMMDQINGPASPEPDDEGQPGTPARHQASEATAQPSSPQPPSASAPGSPAESSAEGSKKDLSFLPGDAHGEETDGRSPRGLGSLPNPDEQPAANGQPVADQRHFHPVDAADQVDGSFWDDDSHTHDGAYVPDTGQNPYGSHRKRRRTRKHRVRRVVAIVACVLLVLVAGGVAYGLWYVHDVDARLQQNLDTDLPQQLTAKSAGEPFYVLLLGIDDGEGSAQTASYGMGDGVLSPDSIMLVRVDPANVKVTMVSIHRDTQVDLGDYGMQTISAAYALGGASYTTQVISQFAGVDISHYAQVDMSRIADIVDKVGGITVNLPVAVDDTDDTGLHLQTGTQALDGYTAAQVCGSLHAYDSYGDGDRYRAANQRAVIEAVAQKILAQTDPLATVGTISKLADSVTTDMTLRELLQLAKQMRGIDIQSDVTSGMEPTTSQYRNAIPCETVDDEAWKVMMYRVDNGLSPTEDSTDDQATEGAAPTGSSSEEASSADAQQTSTDGTGADEGASGDTASSDQALQAAA